MVVKACAVAVMAAAIGAGVSAGPVEIGKTGITPAPCPDQAWEEADSTFTALPGAKVSFGHHALGTELQREGASGCLRCAGNVGSKRRQT